MTMAQIKASEKDVLTAGDICEVLGAHQQWIRDTARQHPELVGFNFTFSGSHMIIPRLGFIHWMEGGK